MINWQEASQQSVFLTVKVNNAYECIRKKEKKIMKVTVDYINLLTAY